MPMMDTQPRPATAPPAMHWGLVLVLGAITAGVFSSFWLVLQARWTRTVTGRGIGLLLALVNLAATAARLIDGFLPVRYQPRGEMLDYGSEVLFALLIASVYTVRYDLTHDPIDLSLGTILPLFLGPVYFQYRLMDYGTGGGDFNSSGRMLNL